MDNSIIIKNLLANKKEKNLSPFESLGVNKLGQTLCAYLNSTGGDVILGISNNKTLVGVNSDWEDRINNEVINKIIPAAPVTCNSMSYQNETVLLISVWPGANKPYSSRVNSLPRTSANACSILVQSPARSAATKFWGTFSNTSVSENNNFPFIKKCAIGTKSGLSRIPLFFITHNRDYI